ncbi:MAG: GGDEF domain-containing protein [Aquabacterium sp.]|uniref:GGDEF domain-containing protein n=1 Tax=Aquabacterium sp. TaxID=1872578 RepID=UPI002728D4C3|nr:GGDEF domain-containing protein [Aquabacterium sp.]MDO9002152.1 GGDEF domain-containing protein [Aquabacterium sp.]
MLPPSPLPPDEPALLEQVDAALRAPRRLLGFEPAIERRFRDARRREQLKATQLAGVLMSAFMCLFLLADHAMTPDVFTLALWLRLGFLATVALLTALTFKVTVGRRAPEWQAVGIGLSIVGLNLYLLSQSDSPLRQLQLLGSAMVILYLNVLLRPRFQLAAMATGLMLLAVSWTGLSLTEAMGDLRRLLPVLVATAATASCSLYFLYQLEAEERHNYLMSLRHRLLRTRLADLNTELDQLARLDPLTLVANRRHADEHLGQLWQRAQHGHGHLAVLMIDIDHFKAYNDRHGHPAGDACLRAVAQALQHDLRRAGDLLARYGGEEFIAVLHGVPPDEALRTAERIAQAVRDLAIPHEDSPKLHVTISVGLCSGQIDGGGVSVHDWVAAADQALYDAKRNGRDCVRCANARQGQAAA